MGRELTAWLPEEPPPSEDALSLVVYVTNAREINVPAWTTQGPDRPHVIMSVMRVTTESETAAVRADMARLLRLWAARLEPELPEASQEEWRAQMDRALGGRDKDDQEG